MNFFIRAFLVCHIFALLAAGVDTAYGAGPLLIAYGGHNETMAPIWVGIERGLQSAADPQRSDHDGDVGLRRRAAGLVCPFERAKYLG